MKRFADNSYTVAALLGHSRVANWRNHSVLLAMLVTLALHGCAGTETRKMLNSRLGLMNYEEAIQTPFASSLVRTT